MIGLHVDQKNRYVLTCQGLYYGDNGYKTTTCKNDTLAMKVKFEVSYPIGSNEVFYQALINMPSNWAYMQGGFVCFKCLEEATRRGD